MLLYDDVLLHANDGKHEGAMLYPNVLITTINKHFKSIQAFGQNPEAFFLVTMIQFKKHNK